MLVRRLTKQAAAAAAANHVPLNFLIPNQILQVTTSGKVKNKKTFLFSFLFVQKPFDD